MADTGKILLRHATSMMASFRSLCAQLFVSYRPELHYMRGPGPSGARSRKMSWLPRARLFPWLRQRKSLAGALRCSSQRSLSLSDAGIRSQLMRDYSTHAGGGGE